MASDRRERWDDEVAAFGTRLSACRRSARMTQQELADRSGLSVRAISNLELGRARSPHPGTVRRLADALGLNGDSRAAFLAAPGRRLTGDAAGPVPEARSARAGRTPPRQDSPPLVAGGRAQRFSALPRQLPPAVPHFTGRNDELEMLTALLKGPDSTAGTHPTVVISAIGGTAGVGKPNPEANTLNRYRSVT